MFRLTQIIRNLYLRLEGFFYQIFGFTRKLFGSVFNFFAQLFGFSQSQYYLETNESKGIKAAKTEQPKVTEAAKPSAASSATRRRPDPNMEYYRNLARQVRKSS